MTSSRLTQRSNAQRKMNISHGVYHWRKKVNTLRPRQNGRHFAADTFNRVFVKENVRISINLPLKFVPKGPISNIPALVQIMAWRRPGDKPLSEPVMVSLLTHIRVTRPQWVNIPALVTLKFSKHESKTGKSNTGCSTEYMQHRKSCAETYCKILNSF